jgi:hypothetical protein
VGLRLLIAALLLVGCANAPKHGKVSIAEEHGEPILGFRAAMADLADGDTRLDIFLGIPDEDVTKDNPDGPVTFKEVLYCIAENDDKKALREIHGLINAAPEGKPLGIYGIRTHGQGYKLWSYGLDCRAKVVSVWQVKGRKFLYLNAEYMPSWRENLTAKTVLKRLVEGAKQVKDLKP